MRKRAVIVGLILVPLVTGGAVIASFAEKSSAVPAPAEVLPPASTQAGDQRVREESTKERANSTAAPPSSTEAEVEDPPETSAPTKPAQIESEEISSRPMLADSVETSEPAHRLRLLAANASPRGASRKQSPGPSLPNIAGTRGASGGSDDAGGNDAREPSAEEPGPALVSLVGSEGGRGETIDSGDDTAAEDTSKNEPPFGDSIEQSGPALAQETQSEDYFPHDLPPDLGKQAPVRVPEPSTMILLGLGLVGCALVSRKARA